MQERIQKPPKEVVTYVNSLLLERGIHIPYGNIDISVAAMCHWLTETRRGQEYMAYILKLDTSQGRHENEYLEKDKYTHLTKEIKPDNIIFLRGCIVDGKAYPASQIEINKRESESCESCGCSTVCIKEIETHYGTKKLCSHCSSSDEVLEVRNSCDLTCEECTFSGCSWHPVNVDAPPFESCI